MTRYDNFVFLYHCLLECLQVFDRKGELKEIAKVKADFDTALEYLKEWEHKGLKEEIKSIEACKNDLFTFYKSAEIIVAQLAQTVAQEALKMLCGAWQCHKNALKAKNTKRKRTYFQREKDRLKEVEELLKNTYQEIKNENSKKRLWLLLDFCLVYFFVLLAGKVIYLAYPKPKS